MIIVNNLVAKRLMHQLDIFNRTFNFYLMLFICEALTSIVIMDVLAAIQIYYSYSSAVSDCVKVSVVKYI